VGLILCVAAACGIPGQDSAQVVTDVPAGLLAVTSTTAVAAQNQYPYELVLYWHAGQGRLVRVVRNVETPPTLQEAVDQLLAGPTQAENANPADFIQPDSGLTQLAPSVSSPDENGVVTVTVSPDSGFRNLDNKRQAAAELVCTITEFPGTTGVIVRDDQPDPIGLVGTNSEPIDGPANRSEFGDCLTDNPPTTATSSAG
jgi:hypothetical protein